MPWYTRWRNVFRVGFLSEELDAELQFHLAEMTDRLIESGKTEQEARLQARLRLGNYSIQKERTRDVNVVRWLEAACADFTFGLRQFKLNPGFAVVAILSLALGIGATTAIFQLLDAIRLRGLPVKDPWQLATPVRSSNDFFIQGAYQSRDEAFTSAQMEELGKRQQAFSDILLFWPTRFDLSTGGQSRYAESLLVSSNYFDVLGVTPIAGTVFAKEDDRSACSSTTAVLSYGFWQREFGGNLNAIGKDIHLDGHRFKVGAITPRSFSGLEPGEHFDVILPLCADNVFAANGKGLGFNKEAFWLTPIGRLRPGWTVERASAHLGDLSSAIFRESLPSEYRPDAAKQYLKNRFKVVSANSGVSNIRRQYENPLWILMAITGSVLLIACANLANLLLARASAREREIAVRQALGASRSRVILQLLSESLLLAAAGATLGCCLALGLSRMLLLFLNTSDHVVAIRMGIDWNVFGFLAALTILTCILFGLAPAIRASGQAPGTATHGARTSTASRERSGLRRMLVASQVALSLILLAAAMLFGRSLQKLLAENLGFDARNVLVATVTGNGERFQNRERQRVLWHEVGDRIGSSPGVAAAASAGITPFSGDGWNQNVHADSDPARAGGKQTWLTGVGPGYFGAMGTPILAGRDLTSRDDSHAPKVAIVNQAFAKALFGSRNPVGRSFRLEDEAGKADPVYQIVGLVADTKYFGLSEKKRNIAFLALDQDEHVRNSRNFVIRGRGSVDELQRTVQGAVVKVDPNLLVDFHLLDLQIRDSTLRERLMANLSIAFGILAASLSALGLYGVMSYTVARRKSEIGIRVAIGATRGNVYRLVAKDAAAMVAAGLLTGVIASLLLARFAESLLFGLKGRDPFALTLAGALLAITAAFATYLPARRAARLDPMAALREE